MTDHNDRERLMQEREAEKRFWEDVNDRLIVNGPIHVSEEELKAVKEALEAYSSGASDHLLLPHGWDVKVQSEPKENEKPLLNSQRKLKLYTLIWHAIGWLFAIGCLAASMWFVAWAISGAMKAVGL